MQAKTIFVENRDLLAAPRRRLLLVEDDMSSVTLQRAILERAGWEVHVESGVKGALSFLHRYRPDLVLTDLSFPLDEVDGFDVLLQNNGVHGPLSRNIIVVSGRSDDETKDKANRLGARDFISKPFAPEQYRRRVAQVMFEIENGRERAPLLTAEAKRNRAEQAFEGALTTTETYLLLVVVMAMLSGLYYELVRLL